MDNHRIGQSTLRTGYLIEAVCKGCASDCTIKFKTTGTPDEKNEKILGACWVDGQLEKTFVVKSCKKIKIEVL
jgi:hypothetical protein